MNSSRAAEASVTGNFDQTVRSLSIKLPVERLNTGKEAHMDSSFQKFDLIPQSYTISMTMTLLFFGVLMVTLLEVCL